MMGRAATPSIVIMAEIIAASLHRSRCGTHTGPTVTERKWAWDAACAVVGQRDQWENYGDPLAEVAGEGATR